MEQSLYGLAVFMHKFKILNRMGFILNILEAKSVSNGKLV